MKKTMNKTFMSGKDANALERSAYETPTHKDNTETIHYDDERKRIIRQELASFVQQQGNVTETGQSQISKLASAKETEQHPGTGDLCRIGEKVANRFQVASKLREGGFGQIFKAYDMETKLWIALKVEKIGGTEVNMESHVLKKFQNQPHCPYLFASGKTSTYIYTAMQLLGKNLSELRRLCLLKPTRLSVNSTIRSTYQCLEAIEALHRIGFLHRDIKPSNFAIGGTQTDRNFIYMLDFGLARYYLQSDGTHKQARRQMGFRGTIRYASTNTHQLMDILRRDDLWRIPRLNVME